MLGKALVHHFNLPQNEIKKLMIDLEPLSEFNPALPRIHVSHDDNPHWKRPDELERDKSVYKNTRVIFLVRDPRDIIVSMYFERSRRSKLWINEFGNMSDGGRKLNSNRIDPFKGTLSSFIYEDVGSLKTIVTFLNIWADILKTRNDVLLVRYEDLHEDPEEELRKIFQHLGVNVDSDTISDAVKFASFANMRKMEKENRFDSRSLQPGNFNDEESYKTRKGVVRGYIEYLSAEEINYIDQFMLKELSNVFGYSK